MYKVIALICVGALSLSANECWGDLQKAYEIGTGNRGMPTQQAKNACDRQLESIGLTRAGTYTACYNGASKNLMKPSLTDIIANFCQGQQ